MLQSIFSLLLQKTKKTFCYPALFGALVFNLVLGAVGQQAIAAPGDTNFGFFMVHADEVLELVPETESEWVRMAGVFAWGRIEPIIGDGVYRFGASDTLLRKAKTYNVQMVLTLNQINSMDEGASQKNIPTDMDSFLNFVRAFVERYDGDGINDATDTMVVKHWQIGNEADNFGSLGECREWCGSAKEYASYLSQTARAIKEADPTAKVVVAGLAQGVRGLANFHDIVMNQLDLEQGGQLFDIFDVHWFGLAPNNDYVEIDPVFSELRNLMAAHYYNDVEFWMTETATYSDLPLDYELQTEEEQARDLVKRLTHFRSLGVEKVFWVSLKEFHDFYDTPNNYFDNVGLINNPLNDGDSSKKKAYFTFQHLAAKINGATYVEDGALQTELLANGVRSYKFVKNNTTYYVFWIDDTERAGTVISFATDIQSMNVYHMVPDEADKILQTLVDNQGGQFQYTIGVDPLLVEEVITP